MVSSYSIVEPIISVPVAPAEGGREECDGEEEEVEGEEGEQTLVVLAHHVAWAARAVVEDGLVGVDGNLFCNFQSTPITTAVSVEELSC